jgi:hypothetical protein
MSWTGYSLRIDNSIPVRGRVPQTRRRGRTVAIIWMDGVDLLFLI